MLKDMQCDFLCACGQIRRKGEEKINSEGPHLAAANMNGTAVSTLFTISHRRPESP
jgi:hypothetical protein